MNYEKHKLEFIIDVIRRDGDQMLVALDGDHFEYALDVIQSFCVNLEEHFEDGEEGAEVVIQEMNEAAPLTTREILLARWKVFLRGWRPSDDCPRH